MLRRLYDWTMAKAAHPHAEWWLAFFAFVESSFFPIPPHPLLGLMCLAEPRKAIRFALITTIASVLGGLFGYAIGYFLYQSVGVAILALVGLTDSFPEAACYLREYDVEVIFLGGASPIPYKLLTITAGFIEMALVPFTLASLAARGLGVALLEQFGLAHLGLQVGLQLLVGGGEHLQVALVLVDHVVDRGLQRLQELRVEVGVVEPLGRAFGHGVEQLPRGVAAANEERAVAQGDPQQRHLQALDQRGGRRVGADLLLEVAEQHPEQLEGVVVARRELGVHPAALARLRQQGLLDVG